MIFKPFLLILKSFSISSDFMSHNVLGIRRSSPPYRSFRFAPFPRLTPPTFLPALVLLRKPLFGQSKRRIPRTLCDIKSELIENDFKINRNGLKIIGDFYIFYEFQRIIKLCCQSRGVKQWQTKSSG